jgi:hypothetical protein
VITLPPSDIAVDSPMRSIRGLPKWASELFCAAATPQRLDDRPHTPASHNPFQPVHAGSPQAHHSTGLLSRWLHLSNSSMREATCPAHAEHSSCLCSTLSRRSLLVCILVHDMQVGGI